MCCHNPSPRVHYTEESIKLVLHTNIFESACGQLSMCSHILSGNGSSVTSMVEWGVDLIWQMQFHAGVLTTLKGHEPLPGMVYDIIIILC